MLEKMPAKGIAGITGGLVAGRNPGAALDQVVAVIEGGGGKVVVERMHLEAGEAVDGGFGPLPDVADKIVDAVHLETVHRAGRGIMLQVDVARRPRPVRLILTQPAAQQGPLG